MRIPLLLSLALCFSSAATAQTTAHWGYEGEHAPKNWGKLDPAYSACAQGKEQSPIDIRGVLLNKALKPIEIHYAASAATIENNGHTVMVKVAPGSYIVVNGVRSDLLQFHFHHPSEEVFGGKPADMDIHLVHSTADGKLTVLAVELTASAHSGNSVLAAIWPQLPAKAGDSTSIPTPINPAGLLPDSPKYWSFMGSLTTPPCTEGVSWFVFQQKQNIRPEQLQAFGQIYKANARPALPLNGRKIEANE